MLWHFTIKKLIVLLDNLKSNNFKSSLEYYSN